jgi:NAD(P)-dependent dehydrogenase (short-subunit alcohol dehydrogenase family)
MAQADGEGRRLVVTGAAGVLGQAVGALARQRGWQVVGIDFAAASANTVIGGVDLAEPQAAAAVLDRAAARLGGGIDALACVAGGFAWEPLGSDSAATFERMWRLNLLTAINACAAALPHLSAPGGAIVLVGAASALKAGAGVAAYAGAKAAVHRLVEALAEEQKPRGIRVNAVLPSIIDTPANRADMPDADFARWVRPDEVAQAMLFLASPAASGITGALLPVTGRV